MFCPGCGLKEDRPVQFCRACGADLRAVRESLEQADAPEPSVAAAREEIARALAARIRDGQWWQAGGLAAEAEKLFETPRERRERRQREDEERRLARTRAGTVTAAVGLGLVVLVQLLRVLDDRAVLLVGPSVLVFLVGLGIIVNGLFFTRPREPRPRKLTAAPRPSLPDNSTSELDATRGELGPSGASFIPASVTEHTTQHLGGEALKTPRS
ncbi:MAG TPA: hypothetical protein VNZ44_11155 [Pyrinomonadaceae bacterium]|nr:hypothetical protein [Pyrinomonadaceae bacterium]